MRNRAYSFRIEVSNVDIIHVFGLRERCVMTHRSDASSSEAVCPDARHWRDIGEFLADRRVVAQVACNLFGVTARGVLGPTTSLVASRHGLQATFLATREQSGPPRTKSISSCTD